MKPIELARLERALHRAAARLAATDDPSAPRVVARARGNVHVFPAREIARFRALDKYTVFAVDGVEYLSEESLAALEHRLVGLGFLRVHRRELVQLARVRALIGPALELVDRERVPVSRRALPMVRAAMTRTL